MVIFLEKCHFVPVFGTQYMAECDCFIVFRPRRPLFFSQKVEKMTKRSVFLFFGCFFLLSYPVSGQIPVNSLGHPMLWGEAENTSLQWTFQGREYTHDASGNLCPFTVEVYPEVLYVGEPLHVRINFRNNTDKDTYVGIFPLRVRAAEVEFYFRHGYGEVITWSGTGSGGLFGGGGGIRQRVKPGEEAPAKYMTLGFPEARYGEMRTLDTQLLGCHPAIQHAMGRWREIRTPVGIRVEMGGYNKEMRGQLLVVIDRPQTMVSLSQTIVIRQRPQEEMAVLEEMLFAGNNQGRDLEQIIPKLAPGTLKNLLKYQLLLLELRDGIREEPRMSGTQILELLEKIESFLQPLHEIERESLKRRVGDVCHPWGTRQWFENDMKTFGYSDEHLEKFREVFGKGFTFIDVSHIITPAQLRGENRPNSNRQRGFSRNR
jgi:hypothetical protein